MGGLQLTSPVQMPGGGSQVLQRPPGPGQGWRGRGQGEVLTGGWGALRLVAESVERGQGRPSRVKHRKGLGARQPQSCPQHPGEGQIQIRWGHMAFAETGLRNQEPKEGRGGMPGMGVGSCRSFPPTHQQVQHVHAPGELCGQPGPRATFWTRRTASIHGRTSEAPQEAARIPPVRHLETEPLPSSFHTAGCRRGVRALLLPAEPTLPMPAPRPATSPPSRTSGDMDEERALSADPCS